MCLSTCTACNYKNNIHMSEFVSWTASGFEVTNNKQQTVHFSWHSYSPKWVGKGFRLWKVCIRGAQMNSIYTSCRKMWDVNFVSCMGQRHGSVLQISASSKLQKFLLMPRNIKFKECVNITMTLSLLLVGNKRIVVTLIV